MSIGGQIKHAFHHAAHQVEHAAEDTAHKAKDEADKAGDAVDSVADEIQKIVTAGDEQVSRIARTTSQMLAHIGDEIEKDIEDAEKKVVQTLTTEAVKHGLSAAHAVLSKVGAQLKNFEHSHPNLVDAVNALGDSIVLGPVVLHYANFYTRADALLSVLNGVVGKDFKLTQKFVTNLIRGLGPDSIEIDAEIVLFSSFGDVLSNISIDLFIELEETILGALGVPKT